MKYLLAHDIGTTGDKATLFNVEGQFIAGADASYETYYPGPGMVEQNPAEWWAAFRESTQTLLKKTGIHPDDIVAVSISGQMMAVVAVGADGEALRPAMIWADTRAEKQMARFESMIDQESAYRITGTRNSPTYQAIKIAWLKDNEPRIYESTSVFLQAKDYLNLKMTGRIATDHSDAVMTGVFDITRLQWSPELIAAAGIDREKLPEIVPSITDLGTIRKEVARDLGLSSRCRVIIGAGDGCCAAVGAGAVHAGDAYMYLGSSAWVSAMSNQPAMDPEMRIFSGVHARSGLYFPSGTMQAGGSSYEWVAKLIAGAGLTATARDVNEIYSALDNSLVQESIHPEPILFLPYLLGERCPIWDPHARGAFIGISASHKPVDVVRAVVEGVCLNLRWILEILEETVPIPELRAIGGGVRSTFWKRTLADVMGKSIRVPGNVEGATSMGAAIVAGVGAGFFDFDATERFIADHEVFEPERAHAARYDNMFNLYKNAYTVLKPTFKGLSA